LVSNVVKGGPADKAGLQTGDVIRKANGQPIIASGDLPALIGQATPGEKLTLEVWRQGQRKELTAQLGDAAETSNRVAAAGNRADKGKLGLAMRPLQPQERREAGVEGGLLVESVGGPAALAGVLPGDVVVAVNGMPVNSVDSVRKVLANADKSAALLIERDGSKIFIPVRLG
jgi:serine protease Do